MITATANRVSSNTSPEINSQIWQHTEQHMREVAAAGRSAIEQRLRELDTEWDIERYVETMAPTFTLVGLTLGLTTSRRWLLLPFVVQGFFLRILDWQVFTPDEQERLYMQLLTSERLEVSDTVRKLILEEWPELAHKLAPKRSPD